MTTLALLGSAHIHTPGFVKMIKNRPEVSVKYVFDPAPQRAQRWASELGAKVISSPNKALNDESVQGVVICSETFRHKKLVEKTAAAKKHMFVEKPMGMGAKDSLVMAQAINKAGVIFQTGYFNRGNPMFRFIREQVQAGNLGTITRIRGCNVHSGAIGDWFKAKPDNLSEEWRWMADPTQSGCGGFGDLGTHLLDILMWIMGDVAAVTADIKSVINRYDNCDETGEALIKFKNGTIGTLTGAWLDHENPMPLLVSGTEGHAAVIRGQLFFKSSKVTGADGKEPWTQLPSAMPHAFELFLEAIQGKQVPLVSAEEAAMRVVVMEAMYKASKKGKWVNV